MAIEIVDFPIENGGSFHSYVNVYQRVTPDMDREAWTGFASGNWSSVAKFQGTACSSAIYDDWICVPAWSSGVDSPNRSLLGQPPRNIGIAGVHLNVFSLPTGAFTEWSAALARCSEAKVPRAVDGMGLFQDLNRDPHIWIKWVEPQ